MRTSKPKIIMTNLCISLLCVYLMFVFGVGLADPETTVCKVVAVLVHYFLLSSTAWTSVEAMNMYYLFVKVTSPKPSFMYIGAALAWGLPSIPIVGLLLLDTFNANGSSSSFYGNIEYCYITNDLSGHILEYLFGLIFPICIVIVCNSIINRLYFVQTLATTRQRSSVSTLQERKKRVTNAVAISLLLGLTWVFGFLSFDYPGNIVFLILFCFFNSFQGVAIFYLFCIRQEECRNVWKTWLRKFRREHGSNRIQPSNEHVFNNMFKYQ